jgi:NDP-sugar pyrophosphorylase family protein
MDHLVERMQSAGCDDLRVVTTPAKRDVIEHAEALGARVIEGRPASVAASLLLGLQGVRAETVVLFGFPDTLWEPRKGFRMLLTHLADDVEVVLGVFRGREPRRSDVVLMDDSGRIKSVQVKPDVPGSDLIWGCGAARARALHGLARHDEPGDYFDALARGGGVRGVYLSAQFVDIGTPESLRQVERAPQ